MEASVVQYEEYAPDGADFLTPGWNELIPEWDDPIWYKPNGELWPLEYIWYKTERVKEAVLARRSEEEVFALARGEDSTSKSTMARKWRLIASGEQRYASADMLDRLFVRLDLPPFHSVIGNPDAACKHAPRASLKGREPTRGNRKLTSEQRFEIRRRKAAGESYDSLAEEYGVVSRTIRRI